MRIESNILVFLIILPCSLYGQSISKLDEKNGFKNFLLGSDIKNYKNLTYEGSIFSKYNQEFTEKFDGYISLDFKTYYINNEKANIGDLELGRPTYYFFSNRLIRVDFYAGNWEGKELIKLYRNLYGNPKIVNEKNFIGTDVATYFWQGTKLNDYGLEVHRFKAEWNSVISAKAD